MKTADILEPVKKVQSEKKPIQYVYSFKDGDGKNKHLLGGKGANLCEMTQIGLNVPAGFVITTEACLLYLATPNRESSCRSDERSKKTNKGHRKGYRQDLW